MLNQTLHNRYTITAPIGSGAMGAGNTESVR